MYHSRAGTGGFPRSRDRSRRYPTEKEMSRGTFVNARFDHKHFLASSLPHKMYYLNGFRRSPPPQKRQLIVLISNSKQDVDDFVADFLNLFNSYIL